MNAALTEVSVQRAAILVFVEQLAKVAKVVAESPGAQLHWMLTPKVARTLYEVSTESVRPKTKQK